MFEYEFIILLYSMFLKVLHILIDIDKLIEYILIDLLHKVIHLLSKSRMAINDFLSVFRIGLLYEKKERLEMLLVIQNQFVYDCLV